MTTKVITNNRPILLGKCGENEATLIKFPINVFFPFVNATSFSLVHQRHGDVAPYPCVISQGEGFINWSINSADVANQGNGVAQLTAYNEEGLVAKTVVFTTVVTDSLGYVTPPAPQTAWVDQVAGYASQAEQAAVQASESVSVIQNLGVSAETGSPVAVRKVIDPDTGAVNLIFTIPSGAAVTVDTSISRYSRNPVENRVIANALPLTLQLTSAITLESMESPAVVTDTVELRGDYDPASIITAILNRRLVLCFVHVSMLYYGEEQYSFDLPLLAKCFESPTELPEPPDPDWPYDHPLSPISAFVEFRGELPESVDGSYPGGTLILRSEVTALDYNATLDVIYEQNASSAN